MDVYWPREHSNRKRGTPAKMSQEVGDQEGPPVRLRREVLMASELQETRLVRGEHHGVGGAMSWGPCHDCLIFGHSCSSQRQEAGLRHPRFKTKALNFA